MASLNKVHLIGNVGRDPELRYTGSGTAVCSISLATSRTWKNKDSGERQEETEWHRVVFFDRLAEIVGEYCKTGKSIYVEGRLQTKKYEKDGVTHYQTQIVADQLQLLGSRGDEGEGRPAPKPAPKPAARTTSKPAGGFDDMDDDIPF